MTQEQLTAFIANAKGNTSLQEKLKAASDANASDANAASAIAKEAGFSISADEFTKAQSTELSDEELEGVAGGTRGLPPGGLHNAFAGYCYPRATRGDAFPLPIRC